MVTHPVSKSLQHDDNLKLHSADGIAAFPAGIEPLYWIFPFVIMADMPVCSFRPAARATRGSTTQRPSNPGANT
jgi:hypothetical protein